MLSLIVFLPLLGALSIWLWGRGRRWVPWFALAVAAVDFLLSLWLPLKYDLGGPQFQLINQLRWIPSFGISYKVGVDGLSLLLVLLTTFLGIIAVFSSFGVVEERVRGYYGSLLALQTAMLGTFLALDMFLFYLFWELTLLPMFFLIGCWGSGRRVYAALKFFLYTFLGSVFMLIALLGLYYVRYQATGELSFDIEGYTGLSIALPIQKLIFWGLFLGFAVKVPLFPLHTWLPDAHTEAPTAGSIILAGVLLKMGGYGFLRFSLPMVPDASRYFAPVVLTLAVIGIIYGALICLAQTDFKRLIAYSSVSHMGFVLLGIFAFTPQGLQGSILQMVNHGISTGGLFLCAGLLYARRHTREMNEYGGLAKIVPVYATFLMIICLSSVGLPGMNGFVGEFLILLGTFRAHPAFAAFATSGVVLAATYLLWMYQKLMFGPVTKAENRTLKDLNRREVGMVLALVLVIFWIGLRPMSFLKYCAPVASNIHDSMQTSPVSEISRRGAEGAESGQVAVPESVSQAR